MYEVFNGNKEIVILLFENGADIDDNDGRGNTTLSAAKESKNKELIKLVKNKLNNH